MPEDSTIRIRQILDLSDFQAKSAQSKAQVAQDLGQLKAEYAQATTAARAAVDNLKSAEAQLGQFAANGSKEAAAALKEYEDEVNRTAAIVVRLKDQMNALKAAQREQALEAKASAAEEQAALSAIANEGKSTGRALGGSFATAKLEAGALSGSVGGIEQGLARVAAQSSILGPIMKAALPVAIFVAVLELLPRMVAYVRDLADAWKGVDLEFDTARHGMEENNRVLLESIHTMESFNRAKVAGAEGTRKLGAEIAQESALLDRVAPMYNEARANAERLWQAQEEILDIKRKGGPFGALEETELKRINEQYSDAKKWLSEINGVYQSLLDKNIELPAQRQAEIQKEALANEKAALEARHRAAEGAHQSTIEYIKSEAEASRVARQNAEDEYQSLGRYLSGKDEAVKVYGKNEQTIAFEVLAATQAANAQRLKSEQQYYEETRRLAERHRQETGANVTPEITGLNASQMEKEAEIMRANAQAEITAQKEIEQATKKTAEAVDKVLGAAMHARMEDIRHTGEEAHREFEQEQRDAEATARTKIDAARSAAQETLADMNLVHTMTVSRAKEEIAVVRDATRKQEEAITELEDFRRATGTLTIAEQQRIAKARVDAERQAALEIKKIQREELHNYEQMFSRIADITTRDLTEVLKRQKTFGQAMADVYNQMVESIIANLGRWLAQELAAELTHQAIAKKGIVTDAGSAGASAFRWVMKEVPFPVNAVLAPVAAAAAFSGVMAFGGSFEHGGIIPGSPGRAVPVVAHGGEMFLGTKLSQTVQRLSGGGGGGGGVTHNHMSVSPTFVVNHPLTESDVRAHSRTIAQVVTNEIKKFNR